MCNEEWPEGRVPLPDGGTSTLFTRQVCSACIFSVSSCSCFCSCLLVDMINCAVLKILFCNLGMSLIYFVFFSFLSLQGAITVQPYSRYCMSPGCNQLLTYKRAAKKEGIFFLTASTCVGDEIAWDFVNLVTKSHISFTAFCKEMTRRYKTTARNSRAFISPKTFIDYFFAWMSAFKIDYTLEVDPFCKHNPPMLACDGTHVGLAAKFQQAPHPVIMVDDPGKHTWPSHRR